MCYLALEYHIFGVWLTAKFVEFLSMLCLEQVFALVQAQIK